MLVCINTLTRQYVSLENDECIMKITMQALNSGATVTISYTSTQARDILSNCNNLLYVSL